MSNQATSTQLRGPAGALHVDDGGAGPAVPVLFVHSAAGNATQWQAQLEHLRRTRRAIAVDLRGHGRSAAPRDGDHSPAAFAADLAAVLDQLDLDRAVLVGHSAGALACIALAAAQPSRVAGLLLLDPSSDGRAVPPDAAAGLMAALRSAAYRDTIEGHWASMLEASTPAVRDRVLADLRATGPETVIATLEPLLTYDPVTPLSSYRGPRLSVITALNETPAALHRLVPELPHRTVDGTGHWLQLDAPAAVNAILDDFLAAV